MWITEICDYFYRWYKYSTLLDYLGVYWKHTESPTLRMSHQISRTKQKHKNFFDIVWPILVFWWKLKCKFKKISPLNNFFRVKKVTLGISQSLDFLGCLLCRYVANVTKLIKAEYSYFSADFGVKISWISLVKIAYDISHTFQMYLVWMVFIIWSQPVGIKTQLDQTQNVLQTEMSLPSRI